MKTEAVLDREQISELEPHQDDEAGRSFLSGYAIPIRIGVEKTGGRIAGFRFEYPTDDVKAEDAVFIDSEVPRVGVVYSTGVRRVLAVHFAPVVSPAELQAVIQRLRTFAIRERVIGKRLSVQLVAGLIQRGLGPTAWEWPPSTPELA